MARRITIRRAETEGVVAYARRTHTVPVMRGCSSLEKEASSVVRRDEIKSLVFVGGVSFNTIIGLLTRFDPWVRISVHYEQLGFVFTPSQHYGVEGDDLVCTQHVDFTSRDKNQRKHVLRLFDEMTSIDSWRSTGCQQEINAACRLRHVLLCTRCGRRGWPPFTSDIVPEQKRRWTCTYT